MRNRQDRKWNFQNTDDLDDTRMRDSESDEKNKKESAESEEKIFQEREKSESSSKTESLLKEKKELKKIKKKLKTEKRASEENLKKFEKDLKNFTFILTDEYLHGKITEKSELRFIKTEYREYIAELKRDCEKLRSEANLGEIIEQRIKGVDEEIKKIEEEIKKIEEEIRETWEKFRKKSEECKNLPLDSWEESGEILWAKPSREEQKENSEKETTDNFSYPGKTAAKTVRIPFYEVHQSIIDANWALRNGEPIGAGENYVTAHLVFITSDRKHEKDEPSPKRPAVEGVESEKPIMVRGDDKYGGGRTFIDFPIVFPSRLLTEQKTFEDREEFEEFVGTEIGESKKSSRSRGHSEEALSEFMKANVGNFVNTIKAKLTLKYGESEGFKIYELILFMNSNLNICDIGGKGCKEVLFDLQSSTEEGSFLQLLKVALEEQGLKTSTGFPRMLITNSSYELFSSYCSPILTQDAMDGLQCHSESSDDENEPNQELSINAKKIAGKVILSTNEEDIREQTGQKEKLGYETSGSVPFYSVFASPNSKRCLIEKEEREKLRIVPPKSFDGISLISFSAEAQPTSTESPSTSPRSRGTKRKRDENSSSSSQAR